MHIYQVYQWQSYKILWLIRFCSDAYYCFKQSFFHWIFNMRWLNILTLRLHVLMSERISHRLIRRFMPLIYDLTFTKGKGHALQIKSLARICPETKFTSHFSLCVGEHYRVSLVPGIQRAWAAIRQTTDLSSDKPWAALFNNRLESDPVKM